MDRRSTRIRDGEIESGHQVASDIGRDKAAVSRDLELLFRYDLIEYREEESRKNPATETRHGDRRANCLRST